MFFLALISVGGLIAGLLLLRRVPVLKEDSRSGPTRRRVSVIIPARNEESNLPQLLESLRGVAGQVLVVDDGSTDCTAAAAAQFGAAVITSAPLPQGWTGKTWACHQGALAASGDVFLFLDADTRFVGSGNQRIVEYFKALPADSALSILPYHRMDCWYEELSLFFNILVAMGAGGFGKLDPPHFFGQSLLVGRALYNKAGGHQSVKGEILENLHFAAKVRAVGGRICTLGGRGTLEMRMFPEGLRQLSASWQKAFITGAGLTSPIVLALSVYWLTAAMLAALALFAFRCFLWPEATLLYCLNVIQIAWYGRQLGTFRWLTAALYPIPLVFYFAIFARSVWRRKRGRSVTWRGRQI